jgi:hypothetical protein
VVGFFGWVPGSSFWEWNRYRKFVEESTMKFPMDEAEAKKDMFDVSDSNNNLRILTCAIK